MTYTVDESNLARQQGLADILHPVTEQFLDDIPLPGGAECLDVGCGIGSTTRLLGSTVPDPGRVVGVDADPALLEIARPEHGGDGDAEFREADATDLPFPDDTFDVVFGRFLLAHLPEPELAVAEYRRVARPDGLVLVQEPDFRSLALHPPSPSHAKAVELAGHLFDTHMGRKCWHLLRNEGLEELGVRADLPVEAGPGDRRLRAQSVRSISAIGRALEQQGLQSEAENEAMLEGVSAAAEDEERLMFFYTVVSVSGRA